MMLDMMTISDEEFRSIRDLVYKHIGINLTTEKKSLVVGRLQKVIRNRGFSSFSDYYRFLIEDSSGAALDELATRISTNHTFFYREHDHFEFFNTVVLPEMVQCRRASAPRDLRVWSAGCSSGEEPYTLVMLMMEYFGAEYGRWDAGVLGTDISERVLREAITAEYPAERVEPLPAQLKRKYFTAAAEGNLSVCPEVKKAVTFRRLNLMNEKFPFKKPFDVIFCRNVMIYFDQPTRDALVQRFFDWTVPGGYLFIGHSESLPRGRTPFEYIMPAVYRKGDGR